ncbi:MAG: DUF4405 domain-containing protein [Chloroflexi bacterium]|nr:DUF4405 domain-containing protein [Chloroflexota bacterium]
MNTKQLSKWLVDAALFTGFIAAFFLDVTGLDLHQWIGIAAGTIATYHFITHWNWVSAVTRRFFGQMSNKSRLYYLIDAAILLGFFTIVGTGLVISTWLNLAVASAGAWQTVHIVASIVTLLITVLKIGLHWRWIVTVAKGFFSRPAPSQTKRVPMQPAGGALLLNRRGFLGVMGLVGVTSAFALNNAVKSLHLGQVGEPIPISQVDSQAETTTSSTSDVADSAQAVITSQSTASPSATAATAMLQSTPTSTVPVATATAVSAQSQVTSTCSVRCPRGCSYPGHCRRYVDADGNNRCDLGECV